MTRTKRAFIFCVFFNTSVFSFSPNLNGSWCWNQCNQHESFSLQFNKNGRYYKGGYSAVILDGNRIDSNEDAFYFRDDRSPLVQTRLISGRESSVALIQLKFLNENQIEWLILKAPYGAFFAPYKAILNRC